MPLPGTVPGKGFSLRGQRCPHTVRHCVQPISGNGQRAAREQPEQASSRPLAHAFPPNEFPYHLSALFSSDGQRGRAGLMAQKAVNRPSFWTVVQQSLHGARSYLSQWPARRAQASLAMASAQAGCARLTFLSEWPARSELVGPVPSKIHLTSLAN